MRLNFINIWGNHVSKIIPGELFYPQPTICLPYAMLILIYSFILMAKILSVLMLVISTIII
jgi:hypothetical protein